MIETHEDLPRPRDFEILRIASDRSDGRLVVYFRVTDGTIGKFKPAEEIAEREEGIRKILEKLRNLHADRDSNPDEELFVGGVSLGFLGMLTREEVATVSRHALSWIHLEEQISEFRQLELSFEAGVLGVNDARLIDWLSCKADYFRE